jgi:hypothetical protein
MAKLHVRSSINASFRTMFPLKVSVPIEACGGYFDRDRIETPETSMPLGVQW